MTQRPFFISFLSNLGFKSFKSFKSFVRRVNSWNLSYLESRQVNEFGAWSNRIRYHELENLVRKEKIFGMEGASIWETLRDWVLVTETNYSAGLEMTAEPIVKG
jgi:hypothetical protein